MTHDRSGSRRVRVAIGLVLWMLFCGGPTGCALIEDVGWQSEPEDGEEPDPSWLAPGGFEDRRAAGRRESPPRRDSVEEAMYRG